MSAVEWKTYSELGKSSLFTNIEGHPGWSACSQIVADRRKWAIGLGFKEDSLLQEISQRLKSPIACTPIDRDGAPVKEIQLIGADADLYDLPAATVSARDAGRYIPSGITFVKDPDTGVGNMSLHRQQIMGRDKTGFVMLPRHARRVYDKYSARGEPTPVAIVIGVHPAIWLSAGYTTGPGIDELELAGGLLGRASVQVKWKDRHRHSRGSRDRFRGGNLYQEIISNQKDRSGRSGYLPRSRWHTYFVEGNHSSSRCHLLRAALRFPPTDTQSTLEWALRLQPLNIFETSMAD